MLRALVLAVLCSGCLQPASHDCGNGIVCPSGFTCDPQGRCVDPDRVKACAGKDEGALCTIGVDDDGSCAGGQCVTRTCGNGIVQPGERCDDGNREDGDGCRGDCASEETCGNGVIDVAEGEQCDCGANAGALGPGCDAPNAVDGFCRTDCILQCGDGEVRGTETCDSGPPPTESCLDYGFDLGNLGCSPVCSAEIAGCDRTGWHGLPGAPVFLFALWAVGPDDVYAVGANKIVHYDGASVTSVPTGIAGDFSFSGVWGAGSDVFVTGVELGVLDGVVLHHDGSAWSRMTLPAGTNHIIAITGRAPNDVWASTQKTVLHYDGTGWVEETLPRSNIVLTDIATAGADVYVVGSEATGTDAVVFRRTSTTWSEVTVPALTSPSTVWATSETNVWIGGIDPSLLHYDGTWTTVPTTSSNAITDIAGLSPDAMYVAQGPDMQRWDGDSLLPVPSLDVRRLAVADRTHVYGITTTRMFRSSGHDWNHVLLTPSGEPIEGVAGTGRDVYAISGDEPQVYVWDGSTWQWNPFPDNGIDRTEVWASGTTVYVAGDAGSLRYTDAWNPIATPDIARGIWGSTTADVIFVGDNGMIYRYTGSGSLETSPTSQTLRDVWGRSASDIYAVGDQGTIVHYNGSGWSSMASGTTANLLGVAGAATATYAVGQDGTVLELSNGTWTRIDLGLSVELRGVSLAGDDDVFVVGTGDTILHYDGMQWSPIRPPISSTDFNAVYARTSVVFVGASSGEVAWLVRPGP